MSHKREDPSKVVGIHMNIELDEQINEYCKVEGRTKRWVVETALREFLSNNDKN